MSISEESFPEDDLISEAGLENDGIDKNSNSTSGGATCLSLTNQSSSGGSSDQRKFSNRMSDVSDNGNIFKSNMKVRNKYKYYSWQDMHSQYSKKRYHHVKSKVKQYIAEITAQDRRKNIARHRSLPEALSFRNTDLDGDHRGHDDDEELAEKLLDQNEEIVELKTMNETLHRDLQEKLSTMGQMQRNIDKMRQDLNQERERFKPRIGLLRSVASPRRSLRYFPSINKQMTTTGTQTTSFCDSSVVDSIRYKGLDGQVALLNLDSADDERTESSFKNNNTHQDDFDSAIDTTSPETDEERNVKVNRKKYWQGSAKQKRTKSFRKRFRKYFLGACCIGSRRNMSTEYFYETVPLSDESFLH